MRAKHTAAKVTRPKTLKNLETVELLTIKEQKKDRSIYIVPLDKKNLLENLTTIGWTNPDAPNPQKALQWLKSLRHDVFLYPEKCFDPKKPPTCIFVPDTPTLNKLIEAVARTPDNKDLLYAKFSDQ